MDNRKVVMNGAKLMVLSSIINFGCIWYKWIVILGAAIGVTGGIMVWIGIGREAKRQITELRKELNK